MNEVKLISLNDTTARVGGYGVVFGGADLDGETFQADTDFALGYVPQPRVYYDHATRDVKHFLGQTVEMKTDDTGLWIEAELDRSRQYVDLVLDLVQKGVLGWSSGSIGHLVQRDGTLIKTWPIAEFSLTPTPAEPRTLGVQRIKQLAELDPRLQALLPQESGDDSAAQPEEHDTAQPTTTEDTMTDETKAVTVQPDPRIDQLITGLTALTETVNKIVEAPATKTAGVLVTGDEADRALKGNPFKNFGEQLIAVRNAAYGNVDKRLNPLKAILGGNESIPSEGGYLVSTAQDPGLDRKVWDSGVFAGRAQRRELPAGSNSMDFYGVQEDTREAGYRFGGVTGYRVAEGATITASGTLKFYKYTLKPKKYAAVIYLTDEVLNDARVLEQEVQSALPAELAFMVDDDMFRGGGANGCFGILNSPALISVTAETGQAATTIVYENIVKMWARRYMRGSYAWFVNQDVSPQLDVMAHTVGLGGLPPRFVNYDNQGAMTMYGAPVVVNEFSCTLGTVGDIVLADWSQYKMATIGGVQGASSMHVQFLTDQMVYRFTWRVDGQPTWKNDLTPFQGSNTVSPFIALATRS